MSLKMYQNPQKKGPFPTVTPHILEPFQRHDTLVGDDGMSLTDVASGAVGAVGGLLGGAAPRT